MASRRSMIAWNTSLGCFSGRMGRNGWSSCVLRITCGCWQHSPLAATLAIYPNEVRIVFRLKSL